MPRPRPAGASWSLRAGGAYPVTGGACRRARIRASARSDSQTGVDRRRQDPIAFAPRAPGLEKDASPDGALLARCEVPEPPGERIRAPACLAACPKAREPEGRRRDVDHAHVPGRGRADVRHGQRERHPAADAHDARHRLHDGQPRGRPRSRRRRRCRRRWRRQRIRRRRRIRRPRGVRRRRFDSRIAIGAGNGSPAADRNPYFRPVDRDGVCGVAGNARELPVLGNHLADRVVAGGRSVNVRDASGSSSPLSTSVKASSGSGDPEKRNSRSLCGFASFRILIVPSGIRASP